MSGLVLPENRPALALVASVPSDWTTPSERLLLLALALDSFDGKTCAPGRDALMSFCGIRHVRTFQRLRDSLAAANDARPALIEVDALSGRHTRYRLLPDSERLSGGDSESLSGAPDLSARPDSERLSGRDVTPALQPDARPVSTTCQHDLSGRPDSDSLSYPSSPLPTQREGEREEDGATAPAPQGADTTRLEADVFAVLRQRWPDDQPVVSKRSRRLLTELRAAGWDDAAIVAGVRGIPPKPRSPALLLEKHLKLLLTDSEPRDFGPVSTVDITDTPTVAAALPIGNTPNPADGVNQKRLAAACKAHGVKQSLFADMCADLAGRGFTVEPLSYDRDIGQDNLLRVRHPAAPGWECNWPITAHRGGTLEAVIEPDLEPTEADREHLIRFWPVELDDNWLTVTPAIVDVATFRQLIDKTYPIAASLAYQTTE